MDEVQPNSDATGRLTASEGSAAVVFGEAPTVHHKQSGVPVGNRLTDVHVSGGITDTIGYTYDARDRLNTESHSYSAVGLISYSYDTGGNQISKTTSGSAATESYTYDDRNRMTLDAVVGGTTTAYAYNDAGDQVRVGGATILWDHNNLSGYSQEFYALSGGNNNYFTGLSVLGQVKPGSIAVQYLLADGHGSTRFVTDSSGDVQNELGYDSFGNSIFATTTTGTYSTMVTYTGQWYRSASGMFDLRARMYQPSDGRFATADSLNFSPGDLMNSNLYLYARDNSPNGSDPTGHFFDFVELLTTMQNMATGLSQRAASA